MTKATRQKVVITAVVFMMLVLAIAAFINIKNTHELQDILTESIEAQLLSTSLAAREILDVDAFDSYNSLQDVENDREQYNRILQKLRQLADKVGADYIYALKYIDGDYLFIFDTDPENEEIFIPYELSDVHRFAFAGLNSADTMNVDDEWGSYNTSAVPIHKDGRIIGIISTDIRDAYLEKSYATARVNTFLLVSVLAATMCLVIALTIMLLRRVRIMQERLEHMAHYDAVTGLPNRQFLLDFLEKATTGKGVSPFALFFIDLDNFKTVNDTAGHDAGDELLRHIARFLEGDNPATISFRPSAGRLNIAARIGGDEFIQLVAGVSTIKQAEQAASRLLADFQEKLNDRYVQKYNVGLSIGVALFPYHTDNLHVLIKYADLAMYHAKNSGKNTFRIYSDEMKQKSEK